MWSELMQRLHRVVSPARLAAGRGLPPTLYPPSVDRWSDGLGAAWRRWLRDGGLGSSAGSRFEHADAVARGVRALEPVRDEFIDAIAELRSGPALLLRERIRRAGSLRELWHLRADVFSLVSLHHSQAEADERLAALNRHFPPRAPRSGFGGLAPLGTAGGRSGANAALRLLEGNLGRVVK